jgi:hypothetical protein
VFDKERRRNDFAVLISESLGKDAPKFEPVKGVADEESFTEESSSDLRASFLFGTHNLR